MTFIPQQTGTVSTLNSTTTPLDTEETYTGTWENVSTYAAITIIGVTDVAGTLYADFSTDGVNLDRPVQLSDSSSSELGIHSLTVIAKFFRVRLVNDGSPQTYLRLQTIYDPHGKIAIPTSRISQTLTNYSDVINTRAGLVGQLQNGTWSAVNVNTTNSLLTGITEPATSFGELSVANPSPVAQVLFIYGINSQQASTLLTGSGSVSTGLSLVTLSTGAASSSSAEIYSSRYAQYRPGQGTLARFTAVFSSGAANSKQYAGIGTSTLSNGLFFGYNGTSFGLTTNYNFVETWVPQASWNKDTMLGTGGTANPSGMTLDPTKGNVFQIRFQYLGFGCFFFYIEDPTTGRFQLVHVVEFPNSYTVTNLLQPSVNLVWRVVNTTNTSNITMKLASGALFTEGKETYLGPRWAIDNFKTGITTMTNILTLKSCTSYNGLTNRVQVHMRFISCSVSNNSNTSVATLRVYKNATVGGTPSFSTINGTSADNGTTITSGNSTISYDTAGTTVTEGILVFSSSLNANNNLSNDVTDLDLYLNPTDNMVFAVTVTASATCGVAVVWNEDL